MMMLRITRTWSVRSVVGSAAVGLFLASGGSGIQSCSADIFHFKDGRVIEGRVNPKRVRTVKIDGVPTTEWIVEIARNDLVIVRESDLKFKGHEAISSSEQDYLELLKKMPSKTAEDHMKIAGQCGLMGLRDLKLAHYERAVELDPNLKVARAAAGYMKDDDGRWQKKEVVMGEKRGKVLVANRWRFPEDVRKEKLVTQAEQVLAPIRKKMNTWNNAASFGRSEQKKREAIANLRQINDPREANILSEYFLDKRRQPPLEIRLLYVQILSRFPVAIPALTNASLNDSEDQVRAACLDALQRMKASNAVPTYLGALGSKSNETVNRAAKGIARFDYPAAVEPLIYALVTQHEVISGGGNNNFNANGGLNFGGDAKKSMEPFENADVLSALTKLTGQDFRYDKNRWLAWYASLYASSAGDLRRDP